MYKYNFSYLYKYENMHININIYMLSATRGIKLMNLTKKRLKKSLRHLKSIKKCKK